MKLKLPFHTKQHLDDEDDNECSDPSVGTVTSHNKLCAPPRLIIITESKLFLYRCNIVHNTQRCYLLWICQFKVSKQEIFKVRTADVDSELNF